MKPTRILLAVSLLVTLTTRPAAQEAASADKLLARAQHLEAAQGDLKAAIAQYEQIVKQFPNDRAVVADALVRMAGAYRKLGDAQAKAIYERVVREYGDQKGAVSAARAALGGGGATVTPAPATVSMRRVWEGPEVDTGGSISPDGRHLAFIDWSTGDLALRDLTNNTSRRLTSKGSWAQSAGYAERAVFSRDGRFIAYSWFGGSEKQGYDIRIFDLQAPAGTAPRRLVPGTEPSRWCMPHDWSPDGQMLLVSVTSPQGRDSLVILDLRTGTATRTVAELEVEAARFSPDGLRLALDRPRPAEAVSDIVVFGINDGKAQVAVPGPGLNEPLAWTPDGHLLFSSTRKGRPGVWLQRMAGAGAEGDPTLVKAEVWSRGLGTTANGGLALATRPSNQEIHVAELDVAAEQVRHGSIRTLDALLGNVLHPAWSPDGRYLAYVQRRDDGMFAALGILNAATGAVRLVQPKMDNLRRPRWAPDGRSVVAQGVDLEEHQGLFRIDVETAAVTALLHGSEQGEMLSAPEESPDGKRLYYIRTFRRASGVESCSIVERDVQTGQERQVVACGGFGRFALAPDGRQVAQLQPYGHLNSYRSLVVVPIGGGTPREVFRVDDADRSLDSVSWLPGGNHLLVVRSTIATPVTREALLVPLSGGVPKKLDVPSTISERIDVHPDGKQLAFVAGERRQEVWVLENYLPATLKPPKK